RDDGDRRAIAIEDRRARHAAREGLFDAQPAALSLRLIVAPLAVERQRASGTGRGGPTFVWPCRKVAPLTVDQHATSRRELELGWLWPGSGDRQSRQRIDQLIVRLALLAVRLRVGRPKHGDVGNRINEQAFRTDLASAIERAKQVSVSALLG